MLFVVCYTQSIKEPDKDFLPNKTLQSVSEIWTSLTWLGWFGFRLKPIFATAKAASKNTTCFKSDPKWLENNHLAKFTKVQSKSLTHSVHSKSFAKTTPIWLSKPVCYKPAISTRQKGVFINEKDTYIRSNIIKQMFESWVVMLKQIIGKIPTFASTSCSKIDNTHKTQDLT